MFLASSHTTKTLAMPSKSTLPYATKQLDDTVINSRTQPFTRQLNTSPPAKRLDGSTWFKSWQLEPKTPSNHCSTATAACQHMQVDTNERLLRLPSSRTSPGQTSRTLKTLAHDTNRTRPLAFAHAHDLSPQTQERRSLTLHLQRGSHATMKTHDFWMILHTHEESKAQHLYTSLNRQLKPSRNSNQPGHSFGDMLRSRSID